jgi:CheY-like chemotaxis protein
MARIVIVEDSPDIRALVRMLLEAGGHEVITAKNGREGVETTRREQPDIVLMDLSLPVLSGWEAVREIKATPAIARIPVLAVTAHAMHGDRERALAAGCDGFIAKPIDEETFERAVAAHLPRRTDSVPPDRATAADAPATTSASGGRILVVDDQPEVAELIRADLSSDGHAVTVASSAPEALQTFSADPAYDLTIIDVMLGKESGYQLTTELIARSPDYLPVLLVTAGTIDRERGYAAGADDFIGKPLESAELRARARSLIRIGRAIREQGRAIRERAEAYEKLAELDRLKSDFLSTVSHELRTPLNTIILLSHLIEREEPSPVNEERRQHDLRVIRDSAETLLRMINNILDLAKLEAGQRDLHPQRFELLPFLREIVDMLEPQARAKGIEVLLEPQESLPRTVVLDREKLSRVLLNLLSNGVKYTREGRVVLRAMPWQGSVSFEVEDTGVGIPPHLVGAAFEPFRQIRPASPEGSRGTGLGLPIAKQLVELMGGDLLLDSQEGRGTRISFTLPLQKETGAASPPPPERRTPAAVPAGIDRAGRARRVLIVEDDSASRYGLKSLLDSEGFAVLEAGSLSETEEVLGRERPDVLVLDITLPDGDGAEWLQRRRRERTLAIPVIAVTGVTADQDRRRIEEAGVAAVLHKPVDIGQLFEALRGCTSPLERRSSEAKPA